MVSEEQDGVVGVPAERAVLAGVGAVVHVVGALRGRVVGAAASEKKKKTRDVRRKGVTPR